MNYLEFMRGFDKSSHGEESDSEFEELPGLETLESVKKLASNNGNTFIKDAQSVAKSIKSNFSYCLPYFKTEGLSRKGSAKKAFKMSAVIPFKSVFKATMLSEDGSKVESIYEDTINISTVEFVSSKKRAVYAFNSTDISITSHLSQRFFERGGPATNKENFQAMLVDATMFVGLISYAKHNSKEIHNTSGFADTDSGEEEGIHIPTLNGLLVGVAQVFRTINDPLQAKEAEPFKGLTIEETYRLDRLMIIAPNVYKEIEKTKNGMSCLLKTYIHKNDFNRENGDWYNKIYQLFRENSIVARKAMDTSFENFILNPNITESYMLNTTGADEILAKPKWSSLKTDDEMSQFLNKFLDIYNQRPRLLYKNSVTLSLGDEEPLEDGMRR